MTRRQKHEPAKIVAQFTCSECGEQGLVMRFDPFYAKPDEAFCHHCGTLFEWVTPLSQTDFVGQGIA